MGKLQELIEKYCPDGVEYKALGELGTFYRGSSFQKKHFVEDGEPCIHYGQVHTQFNLSTDHVVSYLDPTFAAKMKRAKPGDLIIATTSEDDEAVGKAIAWMGDTDVVVSNDAYIYRHCLNPKYMAYVFASDLYQQPKLKYVTGTKVRRVHEKNISKIAIPVPPIEVQREIVRLLDAYTAAHDELVAKLNKEMALIEKRAACYLGAMLTSNENVRNVKLGDCISDLRTGLNPRKNFKLNTEDAEGYYVTVREIRDGKIQFLDKTDRVSEEALERIDARSHLKAFDVLFTATGTVGRTAVIEEKPVNWNIKEGVYAVTPVQGLVDSYYLSYYLSSDLARDDYMKYVAGGTVVSIPMKSFIKVNVPLPSVDRQKEIVAKLNAYSSTAGELVSVLTREIELNQQQLTEFRNKLLSFPEKVA